jgi:putative transposase
MPRTARLDIEGALHHVIAKGIERSVIFKTNRDRGDFVGRLGGLAQETGTKVYAWSLIPNHFHLLVRSGPQGLSSFMRRLLTGYAVSFNKRHCRSGHLFQNRYKSIICEHDPYFMELVRYIHLNPLRSHIVQSLEELDMYAWSGHRVILGKTRNLWQDTSSVLLFFGEDTDIARQGYTNFMNRGVMHGRRPDLSGTRTERSTAMDADRPDARILGSRKFATTIIDKSSEKSHYMSQVEKDREIERIIEERCRAEGISLEALTAGNRAGRNPKVRSDLAYQLAQDLGISYTEIAGRLGISNSRVSRIISRRKSSKATTSL